MLSWTISNFRHLSKSDTQFSLLAASVLCPMYLPSLTLIFFHLRPNPKDQPGISAMFCEWSGIMHIKCLGHKTRLTKLLPSCFWITNLLSPWRPPPLSQLLHPFPALPPCLGTDGREAQWHRPLLQLAVCLGSSNFFIIFPTANSFCKRKGPLVNIDAGRQGVQAVKQLKWGTVCSAARTWKSV